MKKYIIITIAAISLLTVGCKKEVAPVDEPTPIEDNVTEDELVTYSFTIDNKDLKSTLDNSGTFSWVTGDHIAIYNTTSSSYVDFEVKSVDGSGNATIEAEASAGAVWTNAIYPAARATGTGNAVDYTVSTVSGPILVSQVDGQTLSFKYLGAVANIRIDGVPGSPTTLTFTANANVFGARTFSWSGESPVLGGSGSQASITVPFTNATIISVPIPQVSYAGFTITVDNAGGRHLYKKTTGNTFDMTSKKLLPMPKLDYAAPRLFYVHTATSGSVTYDGDFIMLQRGATQYETWVNCDANTISYVYDEYNIGNDVTVAGCLAYTASVDDPNKYRITYNSSTNTASMQYISGQYADPYNWAGFYSNTVYLRGSFDGSNWTNTDKFTGSNHILETTLTTTNNTGEFGIQASSDWWSANTGDGNYCTITDGGNNIYYATLVKGSSSNQRLSALPAGTYTVYANVLQDAYDDRPIALMFVKQ
ncbi:MAG: hypothetical protein J6X77_00855 [Bacteroidales bacterium]|nr:hypothetical protein [Bacteroidales bacterium]